MHTNNRGSGSELGLTRVSVTGAGDGFLVRTGHGHPFVVRNAGGRLVCDCGSPGCAHIEAVVLCGFVEEQAGQQKAA